MEVHTRLEEIFRTVFDDQDLVIEDRTTAADVPGWDSVAHINLMFAIEEAFGVQFSDNQLAAFKNVGQLRDFLERTRSG